MDQSYSENDLSLSPSGILERLQVLRSLQLLQRGKLQKQRLQYQDSPETSSNVTEIVSHFSNSTSYNTFRSLLQSPQERSHNCTPHLNTSNVSNKIKEHDLLDGVSVLNLSQESEFVVNSPTSSKSRLSINGTSKDSSLNRNYEHQSVVKKQISLDEMPILSPKKDFETLVIEKLKSEKSPPKAKAVKPTGKEKQPFLKRGEGLARFGIKKYEPVILKTGALPWRQKSLESKSAPSPEIKKLVKSKKGKFNEQLNPKANNSTLPDKVSPIKTKLNVKLKPKVVEIQKETQMTKSTTNESNYDTSSCEVHSGNKPSKDSSKIKHPLLSNQGKTWAAILTNEQDEFLRKLKQSDYYKNFTSPAKSTISDASCDENLLQLKQERELAEQNMFNLLESKVSSESFNVNNSFFNKFFRKTKLECSGESTPLVMQKCLADNPNLMHIFPDLIHRNGSNNSQSDAETCASDYSECCSDNCSSVSSCCSCKTVESTKKSHEIPACHREQLKKNPGQKATQEVNSKEVDKAQQATQCQDDTLAETDILKANMAEMQAKLVATSELLKERLKELEDEIDTFRKENANLTKLREEVDCERQQFYKEKSSFEQKFNEDKILAEYYLSEEKDKLSKQKQMYERYVREMRGRLNKKDKDEVINLKKEICDLKEEIRVKDAKSTSTIARLRNQIKMIEKEKKDFQEEIEKLKKENRRIHHSNDVTRRLTNMKYLEEINKKLSNMTTRNAKSDVDIDSDAKYKSYEIERESRRKKNQPGIKGAIRQRAKSVPNLNVTSRYAKYFSQRDAVSHMERKKALHVDTYTYPSDNDDVESNVDNINLDDTDSVKERDTDNDDENYLEKIYKERFQSASPKNSTSSLNSLNGSYNNSSQNNFTEKSEFFIRKTTSNPVRNSTSPNLTYQNSCGSNSNRSKSPISILSHRSSNDQKSPTLVKEYQTSDLTIQSIGTNYNRPKSPSTVNVANQRMVPDIRTSYDDPRMVVSPEPSSSRSTLSKTSLKPTESIKLDGTRELRFPNGNVKFISADGKYSKFLYYNGDVKENFYNEGRIKYFYAETKTYHTTHADGLEVLEFPDGQVEKRYRDGSTEIRLPNGSIRYFDPKNEHVREEWRFPDGAAVTVSANGEQRILFSNGQVEVRAKDHKRREFPDGTVRLVYNDGTSETRYASGRVRIKDKHGNLIMDSAPG